jgi:hypothetical protein
VAPKSPELTGLMVGLVFDIIQTLRRCLSIVKHEGLGLLFEHLSELEGDYEFEKIGICCEWTEYKSIEAAKKEYRVDGEVHHVSKIAVVHCIFNHFKSP